jgi:hypothetical protein
MLARSVENIKKSMVNGMTTLLKTIFDRFQNALNLNIGNEMNCQTYNPSNCPSSIQFLYTCIAKAGGTFDSLIQYLNFNNFNSDGSIFSKPSVQAIFQPCMCETEGQANYNFLLCYDINCSKLLSQPVLIGSGLIWKGYCLSS